MAEKQILRVVVSGSNQDGWAWCIICEGEIDGFNFNRSTLVGKLGYKTRADAEFDANEALAILKLAIERAWE